VKKTVSLEVAGRREEIVMKPGEERRVDVPLDPTGSWALLHIRSSSGFRPSAVVPGSRDSRPLGVYCRVVGSS
jgi:hypothetical protein